MTHRGGHWTTWMLVIAVTALAAGCGSDDGTPPASATNTPTRTPTGTATQTRLPHGTPPPLVTSTPTLTPRQVSGAVNGLVVVNHAVAASSGDALGMPPLPWAN